MFCFLTHSHTLLFWREKEAEKRNKYFPRGSESLGTEALKSTQTSLGKAVHTSRGTVEVSETYQEYLLVPFVCPQDSRPAATAQTQWVVLYRYYKSPGIFHFFNFGYVSQSLIYKWPLPCTGIFAERSSFYVNDYP